MFRQRPPLGAAVCVCGLRCRVVDIGRSSRLGSGCWEQLPGAGLRRLFVGAPSWETRMELTNPLRGLPTTQLTPTGGTRGFRATRDGRGLRDPPAGPAGVSTPMSDNVYSVRPDYGRTDACEERTDSANTAAAVLRDGRGAARVAAWGASLPGGAGSRRGNAGHAPGARAPRPGGDAAPELAGHLVDGRDRVGDVRAPGLAAEVAAAALTLVVLWCWSACVSAALVWVP